LCREQWAVWCRLVDPGRFGERRRLGRLADEALGVLREGGQEDVGTHLAELFGEAEVYVVGGVEAYP
jgi:hypothetical protein